MPCRLQTELPQLRGSSPTKFHDMNRVLTELSQMVPFPCCASKILARRRFAAPKQSCAALPPGQADPPHFERARAAARRWRGAS